MSDTTRPAVGTIAWHDLTVANADEVRDFYEAVVGWRPEPVAMSGYSDYSMVNPESGQGVAGVCHARGPNADIPPQWLLYIIVDDVDRAAETCVRRGGQVVTGPRDLGGGRFCVIRDPAGAVCALYRAPS